MDREWDSGVRCVGPEQPRLVGERGCESQPLSLPWWLRE